MPTVITDQMLKDFPTIYKKLVDDAAGQLALSRELAAPSRGNSGVQYKFKVGKNTFLNEYGWQPVQLTGDDKGPAFDPVPPVMVVHDLMEHFPGDVYGPQNEYMAQGSMLWLRWEGDFFGNQRDPSNISNVVRPAFGMLFHHILHGKLETQEADWDSDLRLPETTDYALNNLITLTRQYIVERNEFTADNKKLLLTSLHRGIPWIKRGYHKAAQRYQGLDKKRLVGLFNSVVKRIAVPGTIDGDLYLTLHYDIYSAEIHYVNNVSVAG